MIGINNFKSIHPKQINKTMILVYACLLLIGIVSIWVTVNDSQKDMKMKLLGESRIVANFLKQSKISSLKATISDSSSANYKILKNQMNSAGKSIVDCRFIYLMGMKDNKVVFFVDSEPKDSKDCSPPGQIYNEAPQAIANVFAYKKEICIGPFTDRWGMWVSTFIPIMEPENGKVIAVLGVDVDSKDWNYHVIKDCSLSLSLLVFALVFIFWSFALGRKARVMKYRNNLLSESEEKFRKMFSTHKSVMLLLNPYTSEIVDANNTAVEFYGYSREQICSMKIGEINTLNQKQITEVLDQAIKCEKNQFVFKHKLANGSIRDVSVNASPFETNKGEFLFAIITDITEKIKAEEKNKNNDEMQSKVLHNITEIIDSNLGEIDYNKMAQCILEISGAKNVSFNVFDENGENFTTVALSGISSTVKKASSMLGYELIGKKWKYDRIRESKIKDRTITMFKSLHDLTGENFSNTVSTLIEKTFNLGEVAIVRISKKQKALGDFTLLFARGETIKNIQFVELYANQVGLFLSRMKVEEAFVESVSLNQSLLQTIPFGMDIVDEFGNILFISDSLKHHLPQKFTRQKCWELYRDDKKQCFDCPLHKGIKIGETQSYISNNVLGGKTFEVVHTGMIFEGKKAMLEIFIDITERKKAELAKIKADTKLRTLMVAIEQSPVTTVITDISGNIEYVNPKFTESTGYTFEEAIGQNPRILKTDTISSSEYKELWETIISGDNWQGIFRNKKKSGEHYWESAVISPVKDEDGVITHFLAVKEDITLRKQIEDDLLKAKEDAEMASISKSEFLATMSHEIRTPLNGIIGFSEILLKTKLSEQQNEFAKNVNISAISLLDLINDILDLSKIEAGKLELTIEKIDIISLAENIIDILRFRVSEKGIELLLQITSRVPRFIFADPIRLRQVLVNLLGNASKFTEEGEIELKIDAALIEGNDKEIEIIFSIRDTGIGIAPNKQKEIFNAFSQADSSTNRKYGGTGLGLSISSDLVGKMNSQIQLESKEGIGSCFSFSITVPFEHCEKCKSYDVSWAKKVLIIDDNTSNRNIVESILQSKNVKCEKAANGIVALEMIDKTSDYDVVIVDYTMPYVGGVNVIKNIRSNEKTKNLPIILMHNSIDDAQIKLECKEQNVAFILQKPLRIMQLFDTFTKINSKLDYVQEEVTDTIVNEFTISNNKVKMLIVDDNQMNLNLVSSLVSLQMPLVEIIKTTKPTEVTNLYNLHKPDIILLDIQMPIKNGYEVAKELRATVQDYKKRVPIIALTAGTVAGEKERCLEAGMDDYLSKPINSKQLFAVFDKYLNGNTELKITQNSEVVNLQSVGIHFDRAEMLKTYDNDETIVDTFLKMAFDSMPTYLADLQIAVSQNDTKQIKFNAHTLKGMARGICFNIMAEYALQLEKNYETEPKTTNELCILLTNEFDFLKKEYTL